MLWLSGRALCWRKLLARHRHRQRSGPCHCQRNTEFPKDTQFRRRRADRLLKVSLFELWQRNHHRYQERIQSFSLAPHLIRDQSHARRKPIAGNTKDNGRRTFSSLKKTRNIRTIHASIHGREMKEATKQFLGVEHLEEASTKPLEQASFFGLYSACFKRSKQASSVLCTRV